MNIIKPFLSLSIILFSLHAAGENRTDKLQTYVLEVMSLAHLTCN